MCVRARRTVPWLVASISCEWRPPATGGSGRFSYSRPRPPTAARPRRAKLRWTHSRRSGYGGVGEVKRKRPQTRRPLTWKLACSREKAPKGPPCLEALLPAGINIPLYQHHCPIQTLLFCTKRRFRLERKSASCVLPLFQQLGRTHSDQSALEWPRPIGLRSNNPWRG